MSKLKNNSSPTPLISSFLFEKSDSNFMVLLYFVTVLTGGIVLATVLPPVEMFGLFGVVRVLGKLSSTYIGGVGISFALVGSALCISSVLQLLLGIVSPSTKLQQITFREKVIAILSVGIGSVLMVWYIWSFILANP